MESASKASKKVAAPTMMRVVICQDDSGRRSMRARISCGVAPPDRGRATCDTLMVAQSIQVSSPLPQAGEGAEKAIRFRKSRQQFTEESSAHFLPQERARAGKSARVHRLALLEWRITP
jgi:hypothetical protein